MQSITHGPTALLPYKLLQHAFERRATMHPKLSAVEYQQETMTYGELNEKAIHLASELKEYTKGRIAVIMERCLEFPLALLAALKVGSAMMPLDITLPVERLKFMLYDANANAILTTRNHVSTLEGMKLNIPIHIVSADGTKQSLSSTLQHIETTEMNEAYIVYTSGSTGKPKGVPVLHRGAVNVSIAKAAEIGYVEGARVMQFMAIGFDGFQWDLWKALSNGSTLVLRSAQFMDEMITIDTITCTPTALSLLGHPSQYPRLKYVSVAGEACPSTLRDLWAPCVSFMNLYGPSECAIMTHCMQLLPQADITIGPCIENVHCYILDEERQPVARGQVGEIYLGGVCVSPGYINLPEETAKRFILDPFASTEMNMFRTGDLGCMLSDGRVEIHGRLDGQVKLKGYRIELDEVAKVIMEQPGVVSAAVIAKDKTHLVAFVTPTTVDTAAIQKTVADHLPTYMVPATWVKLHKMPQNINGKVDKKALESYSIVQEMESVESDMEKLLATIWMQVLGVSSEKIGRNASFFALGGDSITAIRLSAKAKSLGMQLTPGAILKNPRLSRMAAVATKVAENPAAQISRCGSVPLTPIQHLNFKHHWENVHFWNQSIVLKVRERMQLCELELAITQLVGHHDALRTRFNYSKTNGWAQSIHSKSNADRANVALIQINNLDEMGREILLKEASLHLGSGPIYAVTLFEMDEQYLHIAVHHTVIDLVSYRILIDDLQLLLEGKPLGTPSMSFKQWSEELSAQADRWSPDAWHEYLIEDTQPEHNRSQKKFIHRVQLDAQVAAQLNYANEVYGTNIQELALAALTASYSQVKGNSNFPLMLEGHGREPWDSTFDISSTIGWFTTLFPIVFTSTDDISTLLRHVKQKIRGVPEKGLSYGAIKYLAKENKANWKVKNHRNHSFAFNYAGQFQEIESKESLFEPFRHATDVYGENEASYIPGNISLEHVETTLVLEISVEEWQLSSDQVNEWLLHWKEWMHKIVEHCLDPSTIGGKTLSDVPLLGSTETLREIEQELHSTLDLCPVDVEDIYPVTSLQAGMLFAMIQKPEDYVLQSTFDLASTCSIDKFQQCWRALAMEEPLLRTVFVSTSSGIYQAVTRMDRSLWSTLQDTWSLDEIDEKTKCLASSQRKTGFSLKDSTYNRFTCVKIDGTTSLMNSMNMGIDGSSRIIWITHHTVLDGWSGRLLLNRLRALANGKSAASSSISFRDYIAWVSSQDTSNAAEFWTCKLEDLDQVHPLALPQPTHGVEQSYICMKRSLSLPDLKCVCENLQVTPSSLIQAAWAILLSQYTRSRVVSFGSVFSGRDINLANTESIVGVLIKNVPILMHVPGDTEIRRFVSSAHDKMIEYGQNASKSLSEIKKLVKTEQELFDTMFMFGNYQGSASNASLSDSITFNEGEEYMDSKLGMAVYPSDDEYTLKLSFNAQEIEQDIVELMMDRYISILQSLSEVKQLTKSIESLDSGGLTERLILEKAHSPQEKLRYELLHQSFEARAQLHPNVHAVEYEDQWISYRDLDYRANTIAQLLSLENIQVGSRVAVIMTRQIEFVVGLLAVLKCGGSMIPIDALFPVQRIVYMLKDANVSVVLTTEKYKDLFTELQVDIPVLFISSTTGEMAQFCPAPCQFASSSDEAYIVYTSGSTGKPKGVPVLHEGAVNVMQAHSESIGYTEGARVMQFMSIGFDGFQWDLWKSLSNGATLVLRDDDFQERLKTISTLTCTPTALSMLGDPKQYPHLRVVSVAGESCPWSLKELWSSHVHFFNLYGPSECAIMTHCTQLIPMERITIGKTVPNVHCDVLDENLHPVPVGVIGEFFLSGICTSPGYVNLPEQTTQRFLPHPIHGKTLFRSGDLGRLLTNGCYEILGRQDTQVKLKGYRIELEEIASAMMLCPGVKAATAIVKDKNYLVGYFAPSTVDSASLEEIVARSLPVYMVPSLWIGLDNLPQNPNGKIDKRALESLDVAIQVESLTSIVEESIATIWSQVLGIEIHSIGRQSTFYSLGGDSISAIKVVAAAKKAGLSFNVQELLQTQKLWRVAELTEHSTSIPVYPRVSVPEEQLSILQSKWPEAVEIYPATNDQHASVQSTLETPGAWICHLRFMKGFDPCVMRRGLLRLIQKREILRTTFAFAQGQLFQVIQSMDAVDNIYQVHASSLNSYIDAESKRGFTLSDSAFSRFHLVEIDGIYHGIITLHHSLYDGWTMSMLIQDILDAYHEKPLTIRPSFCRVIDYIKSQDEIEKERYWTRYLDGIATSSLLEQNESGVKSNDVPQLTTVVNIYDLNKKIKIYGVTMATVVNLAWAMTLSKHLNSSDVVFGQVVSNRSIPVDGVDRIFGCLIHTDPCRVQFTCGKSIPQVLQSLQTDYNSSLSYAFNAGEDMNLKQWRHGTIGFDSEINYQNFQLDDMTNDITTLTSHNSLPKSFYAIEIAIIPLSKTTLKIHAIVDPQRISTQRMEQLVMDFQTALIRIENELDSTGS